MENPTFCRCGSLLIAGTHTCPKCSDKNFEKKRRNNNKTNKKPKLTDYQIQQLGQEIEDLKIEMEGLGHVPLIKVKGLETKLKNAPEVLKKQGKEVIGVIKDYGLYSCLTKQEAHYINTKHENIRKNNVATVSCVLTKEIKCDYDKDCHGPIQMRIEDEKEPVDYCMFS